MTKIKQRPHCRAGAAGISSSVERNPYSPKPKPDHIPTSGAQAREEQVPTERITIDSIMRSEAFRQGLADVRAGRKPRFDGEADDQWSYERGRQFGILAPRKLSVIEPCTGQLNPAAVKFFRMHLVLEDIL